MPDDSKKTTWVMGSSTILSMIESAAEGAEPAYPIQFGEYEVLGKIGAGGCGIVYRARHPRTKALVALKIVQPKLCTPEVLKAFDVEWRAVLALKHRSIASVTDCGRYKDASGEAPFYVMELITDGTGGRPLDLVSFARKKQLTIEQCVELMVQVCGAVQTAHDKGVIHRDLKPENIPVDEADRSADKGRQRLGVPKVVDFGLAHVLGAAIVSPEAATPEYQFAGTLRYMAPEQVRGATGEIGTWTDVHSLGLIAYELTTGKFPYELGGLSKREAIERIQTAARVPAVQLEPRVGPELSDILARASAIVVRDRTKYASELREGLEDWLVGRREQAEKERAARRRHVIWMAVASVVASGLAAYAAMEGVGWLAYAQLNLGAPFERWLCHLQPPEADIPFKNVRVVALDEAFNDQAKVDQMCRGLGIERLSVKELGGLRPLYAKVARLIVEKGGARTVALDIRFEGKLPTPFDQAAADDLRAVNELAQKETGPSIVVGMPWENYDSKGLPADMSPVLAQWAPFVGELFGVYDENQFWSMDLLVKIPKYGAIPSLPAMTFAKSLDGAGTPAFSMGLENNPAQFILGPPIGKIPGEKIKLPEMLLETVPPDEDDIARGINTDRQVHKFLVAMPSRPTLDAATVRLADVVADAQKGEAGFASLRDRFDGKTVIIGDVRRIRLDGKQEETDMKRHASGREIPGVYAIAVATQWLLDGRVIRFPGEGAAWALTWALSAAGVGVVWLVARRQPRTGGNGVPWIALAIWVLAIGVGWMGAVFAMYYWGLWIIYPWVPLSGLVIGATLAWVLVRFGSLRSRRGKAQGVTT